MAYLDDWTKLKADFRRGNDALAQEIKRIKAKLKAEKKAANPDQDAIDCLDEALAQSLVLTKKKTGFSQVLPAYEKLLDKI